MNDLTILTCSYNNVNCLSNMLKSYVYHCGKGPHKILISENSTNDSCRNFLDNNNISYFKNPGYSHSQGMNILFNACSTKYALMLDTDIIILKDIRPILFEFAKDDKMTLLGEFNGEIRGGKKLYPRIAPWFCFVNIDNIKKYGLKFNDISLMGKKINGKYYDVGSYLYENIVKYELKPVHLLKYYEYFKHYEGMSWRIQKYADKESNIDLGGTHNNYDLFKMGEIIQTIYNKEVGNKFKDILIKDCYNS